MREQGAERQSGLPPLAEWTGPLCPGKCHQRALDGQVEGCGRYRSQADLAGDMSRGRATHSAASRFRPPSQLRCRLGLRVNWSSLRVSDYPLGSRKSHLRRARMTNSGLSNRDVRSLPKKMTLSAQLHFLTVQSPQERFKPL
jgi:hypothetical protein